MNEVFKITKNLKSSNKSVSLNAVSKIPHLVECIGSYNTVYELIPYLFETSIRDDQFYVEVLKAFSKIKINTFTVNELKDMIENLRFLMCFDSIEIRNEMINFIDKVIKDKTETEIEEILKDKIEEFVIYGDGEESITGLQIAQRFLSKFHKENSCKVLRKIAQEMFIQDFNEGIGYPPKIIEFIKLCSNNIMFSDDETNGIIYDYIKSLKRNCKTSSILCELPKYFFLIYKKYGNINKCFKNIIKLFLNNDYRVKCSVIDMVSNFLPEKDAPVDKILSFFAEILTHSNEDEVYIIVAQQLKYLVKISKTYSKSILKILNLLLYHENVHCRETLALYLIMFKEMFDFSEIIMPIFLHLMGDKIQEVRIIAIESFQSSGIQFENVIMGLDKMEENWRELQKIPSILTSFNNINNLNIIVKRLLKDDSNAVRMEMVKCLPDIANHFGKEWKKSFLESVISEFSIDEDYKIRQLSILMIIKTEYYNAFSKKIIERALHDPVSNVRLILSQYLPQQYMYINDELKKDSDIDVREYALERFP